MNKKFGIIIAAILFIGVLAIIESKPTAFSTRNVVINNVSYNESQIQNMTANNVTLNEGDTLTVTYTVVVKSPTLLGDLKCTAGMLAGVGSSLSKEMGWEYVTGIYPGNESAWLCNGDQ